MLPNWKEEKKKKKNLRVPSCALYMKIDPEKTEESRA